MPTPAHEGPAPRDPRVDFSVIVANWNGDAWIERALSSIQLAVRATGLEAEILVVDDASDDASPETVRRRFPRVRLLRNRRNVGFAHTVNRGARAARGDILVLLNNDLVVRENFFRELLAPFTADRTLSGDSSSSAGNGTPSGPQARSGLLANAWTTARSGSDHGEFRGSPTVREDKQRLSTRVASGNRPAAPLFAVSARTLTWDGAEPNQLCMAAAFLEGRIQPAWSSPAETAECLFAQGGAMACRRDLYLAFGGFDPIFAPGYWEDYDLCWRAARAGCRILYEPKAVAFHVGGGSMTKRYGAREVYLLRIRNHLIFEWLHITDKEYLIQHAAWLPRHVFREWTRGEGFGFSKALYRAARMLPQILRARARRRGETPVADGNPPAPSAALSAAPVSDRLLLARGAAFTADPAP